MAARRPTNAGVKQSAARRPSTSAATPAAMKRKSSAAERNRRNTQVEEDKLREQYGFKKKPSVVGNPKNINAAERSMRKIESGTKSNMPRVNPEDFMNRTPRKRKLT